MQHYEWPKMYNFIPKFIQYCSTLWMKQAGAIMFVFDTNHMEQQHHVQDWSVLWLLAHHLQAHLPAVNYWKKQIIVELHLE